MEHIKRQRSNSFNNNVDNKRKEIRTYFEDLSNEIIYEIFEFLDYFHVYKVFFKINLRFHRLLANSNLPIKINIPPISKSVLQRYYKDIIVHSQHRINSFRLSNLFMYNDRDFPLFYQISQFPRLQALILDNIQSDCLQNLLYQFISLPFLSSLIISTVDSVNDVNHIYRQIFRLSKLKYCKLSFKIRPNGGPLPIATNEYSSIEYLVIDDKIHLCHLHTLLSYVPQLHRLSFHSLYESWSDQTKISPTVLNNLTHVSLGLDSIKFDQIEQLFKNLFSSIQVLHISANAECMDGNRWEQLILCHLPNLRIFDIVLGISARNEDQINQFTSPFWIERQWFFEHGYYQSSYGNRGIFYSINPYRRKHYTLCEQKNQLICLDGCETHLKSVNNVHIQTEKEMRNSMYYFPNATKLIFEDGFSVTCDLIATALPRIIPLKQLTYLIIQCHHLPFIKLIELLQLTPNIHTLILESMPFYKNDYISIQQSEIFRFVSIRNIIRNVTLKEKCTLEKFKLLVALCPRVQCLAIYTFMKDMEPMIRFLLERNNRNTNHLVSLYFSKASKNYFRHLNTLIMCGKLPRNCTLKYIDSKLYLWW